MYRTVAVIPARGGSKGIPKKNLRDVAGRPLIFYQVNNALQSRYIEKVIVSTDSSDIKTCINRIFGDKVEVVDRPPQLAQDNSKSEEAVLHALKRYDANIVVILEPTNPLNKVDYIDACIENLLQGHHSACCVVEDKGFFMDDPPLNRPMRQYIKPRLRETGNCWATWVDIIRKTHNRLNGDIATVLIPWRDSIHLDTYDDWKIIESFIEHRYFQKREGHENRHYWGMQIDPDGNIRNRSNERDKFIGQHWHKLSYLAQYKGKILDFGCGVGYLLSCLHEDWEKYGVEINENAITEAEKFGKIKREIAWDDNFFDVVVMNHVIEHLLEPISTLNEIWRILKPYGKLILETPDFGCATAQKWGDKFRLLHDQTHISLFNLNGLISLLKDTMFEIEGIEYPFFDTEYHNENNLARLFDIERVSPPAIGNVVTIYAYKK